MSAYGGAFAFFGPYELNIGCAAESVTISDSSTFSNSGVPKLVGDSVDGVYTFSPPTTSQTWCTIISNEVVDADGTTPSTKLANCGSQPCTVFALVDTIHPETLTFKIKTSIPGGRTHLSPLVTTTVSCGSAYSLSEVSTPTNPQFIEQANNQLGFVLPSYVSSQQAGCPTSSFELSTSNLNVVAPTNLNSI